MTIPSTPRKAGPFLGTGAQTTFPFTFRVFAASDILVSAVMPTGGGAGTPVVLTLNSDYSVTLNANQESSPGGTVTYPLTGSPLPVGGALAILGNVPYDQPLDLPSGGNFSPMALENQLDRVTMQVQQLKEVSDRSARMSEFSSPEDVRTLTQGIITLAAIDDAISTVAGNTANVNTVAGDIASVNTVASNITNVVAAGANSANINAVVANASNINAAVANSANINTVAGNVGLMNTVVDNLSAWRDVTAGDDIQVTNFSGTGAQTVFTLPFSPGAENNTQVYISGVYQQKDRYTVSGATLTFSTAPPAGTGNIEVVWSRPFVLGATDAALVGFDGGTVQDVLDTAKPMQGYNALNAYTGRATVVRFTTPGIHGFAYRDDADTTTPANGGTVWIDGLGRRWKRLFDGDINLLWFGATRGVADDTAAINAALIESAKEKRTVHAPGGVYMFTSIRVPAGCPGMYGDGDSEAQTVFTHIAGSSAVAFARQAGRVNYASFKNFAIKGSGDALETDGWDCTGFNYTTWESVSIRGFRRDNWAATGYLTVTGGVTVEDVSTIVNVLLDCKSVSSGTGNGINFYAPPVSYNVAGLIAWNIIGGYFVDNAGAQIKARFGENIQFNGTAVEGSAGQQLIDIDTCTLFGFRGYTESRAVGVGFKIGAEAKNYEITPTRWSFPLWGLISADSVTDGGRIWLAGNSPGKCCVNNGDLATVGITGNPVGLTAVGTMTFTGWVADTASIKGCVYTTSKPASADTAGFEITLKGKARDYFEKRVTFRFRYKSVGGSGLVLQVRPRLGAEDSVANGRFYARSFTPSDTYKEVIADVVFQQKGNLTGNEDVKLRFLFIGATETPVALFLDEIDVYEGGFSYAFGSAESKALNEAVQSQALLSSASAWPNVLLKRGGRVIYNAATGGMFFALGPLPTSAWRPFAGGADIVPA